MLTVRVSDKSRSRYVLVSWIHGPPTCVVVAFIRQLGLAASGLFSHMYIQITHAAIVAFIRQLVLVTTTVEDCVHTIIGTKIGHI